MRPARIKLPVIMRAGLGSAVHSSASGVDSLEVVNGLARGSRLGATAKVGRLGRNARTPPAGSTSIVYLALPGDVQLQRCMHDVARRLCPGEGNTIVSFATMDHVFHSNLFCTETLSLYSAQADCFLFRASLAPHAFVTSCRSVVPLSAKDPGPWAAAPLVWAPWAVAALAARPPGGREARGGLTFPTAKPTAQWRGRRQRNVRMAA